MNVNYAIKKIDEVLNSLRNSKYFCKLDLFKTYLHLQSDEESSIIQTISTHRGTYKMNRLSFGIKTAPSEFNRIQTRCFYYYPIPYINSFIKNKNYYWNKKGEKAFLKLEEEISSDRVLVPFDTELSVTLSTDSSPIGVAVALSYIINNVEKPVAFASRSITEAERNYSQLDRETLAIIFDVSHFINYIYGRRFVLLTDNQPLSRIFYPKTGLPKMTPARLLLCAYFSAGFDCTVKFRKGLENQNVDCLTRIAYLQTYLKSPSSLCISCFRNIK
ncbi:Retrovirus-related Pol polyprotein from transposon 17.6 [Araneus ventricosus]|uniref:Retrovirus-related Pol polyprotein from transposon 17.6 n=1 Tax=Araneus ventricosus TaxID=182803 RepID=A0A4Y2LMD1_ARAVE|nr:Retrovirus-related Pol polyprotein from transposon 17.6 [Araneus ventricosus]